MGAPGRLVAFGPFRLNPDTGELSCRGARVPIQAQPLKLLTLLVAHTGEVVTRRQIRSHLWGDTAVSYNQGINYCVRQVRIALGAHGAAMIRTLPRQGYRFTPRTSDSAGWSVREVMARVRPSLPPLAAALVLGVAIGTTVRIPSGGPSTRVITTATAESLVVGVGESWRWIRAHLTGEANCPVFRILRDPQDLVRRVLGPRV